MSEEKSSPVGMIVGVAVVAVVIGIMIGKSGSNTEPVAENQPPVEKPKPAEEKPAEEEVVREINLASIGNQKILSYLAEQLKKPSDSITDEDYAKVEGVGIEHFGKFDDISILAKCVNLRALDLINGGDNLTDITPLKNLTKLEKINLWGTKVSDLSPLSALSNLKELNLKYCPVEDITPLHGLKSLEYVYGLKKEVGERLLKAKPDVKIQ